MKLHANEILFTYPGTNHLGSEKVEPFALFVTGGVDSVYNKLRCWRETSVNSMLQITHGTSESSRAINATYLLNQSGGSRTLSKRRDSRCIGVFGLGLSCGILLGSSSV